MNDLIARGLGVFIEQRLGGHDHSRRAVTALKGELVDKRLLQRVQRAVGFFQAFDGGDAFAARFIGQISAGTDGQIVDEDRAGAADLNLARDLCAVQIELIAQHLGQCIRRLAVHLRRFTVQIKLQVQLLLPKYSLVFRV